MAFHPVRLFFFGLINFSILVYVLHRLLGSATNQFFYATRARIRKEMLASVMNLRKARAHAAQSRANYDSLPKDMAARRAAILAQCRDECRTIAEEAQRRAEHMLESAARQADEERDKAAMRVRSRLLTRAFDIAAGQLSSRASLESMCRYLDQGLNALSTAGI